MKMDEEFRIPEPTRAVPVLPIPSRLDTDSLSWMALQVDPSETNPLQITNVALKMETSHNDQIQNSVNFGRGRTILDGLEQSGIRNQPEVKHKILMFAIILGLCMLTIYYLYRMDSAQYKIMSVTVAIFFTAWIAYWVYIIGISSQLHRIRVVAVPFQSFYGNMVFPTQFKHYPSRPIKSVSEMLALRGTSIHILFAFMGMAVSCVTATAVMMNWIDLQQHANITNERMNINYLEKALAVCSVFALPMVGFFELDVHSPSLMLMHYFGVLCQALMVWPFVIQSRFSVLSIVIVVVSYLSFMVWGILGNHYPDDLMLETDSDEIIASALDERKMRMAVHRMSVHCLMAQTVGGCGCGAALCLYLWNIEDVCDCH